MFDIQAALARVVYLGYVKLLHEDNEQKRQEDIALWQARENAISLDDHEAFCDFQTEYVRDLIDCCDKKPVPRLDVDRINAEFHKFMENKRIELLTFRDQNHSSVFPPYKVAVKCKLPWLEMKDDSIEEYLALCKPE